MAVVGAGAAGLVAAIRAGECGARVVLFNTHRDIGLKILMSGGGRCNLTHAQVDPGAYHGSSPRAIGLVLKAFPPAATRAWFETIGVPLKEEPGGKVFPASNSARTVVAALRSRAAAAGVEMHAGVRVRAIEVVAVGGAREADDAGPPPLTRRGAREARHSGRAEPRPAFQLITDAGDVLVGAVILCTGGLSYPKTGSDGSGYELARALGHSIARLTPALTPFQIAGSFHRRVQGLTLPAALTLWRAGKRQVTWAGTLLWTHFGISGPAALDMSRHWLQEPGPASDRLLTAHFLPDAGRSGPIDRPAAGKSGGLLDAAGLGEAWIRAAAAEPGLSVQGWLAGGGREAPGRAAGEGRGGGGAGPPAAVRRAAADAAHRQQWRLPARFVRELTAEVGVDRRRRLGQVPRGERRRLIEALTRFPLAVQGTLGYERAEVTAGGVPLAEVDPRRMASRLCPGLFLAGEILDVDGRLGGYNFQWAWSSGWVAGGAAAALADRG